MILNKRTFSNSRITWEETAWDNKFHFSRKDGLVPSREEAFFVFCILYRDVLSSDTADIEFQCEYDESRDHMVVVVREAGTHLIPKSLIRSSRHNPMPSFPMQIRMAEV